MILISYELELNPGIKSYNTDQGKCKSTELQIDRK